MNTMLPNKPLLVAQLTDTHLFAEEQGEMRGVCTAQTLRQVVDRLQHLQPQPDLLLLTGDLSQDESLESYQRLQQILDPLSIPTYWLLGNHDQNLAAIEQGLQSAPFVADKSFQQGGWQFILLNSVEAQQVGGRLSTATLADLDRQLQQAFHLPTLLAVHHHPLPIGMTYMDAHALENAADLFELCDRHPQVQIVLFGHIHQAFDRTYGNVRYLGTPATCIQLKPGATEIVFDDSKPPGFRLLWLYENGQYDTEIIRIGDGETIEWEQLHPIP